MYLTPPLTALIAWVLFDETLSITGALGMLLAVVGVAFVVRK
jgi:drug/metabolite transporter (DMT)-like permease